MADEDVVKTEDKEEKEEKEEKTEQATQLAVKVASIEDAGTLKKRVTVEIPESEIESKLDENFGELASSGQVPGFRIGRAPRRLIEKRFGKDVRDQVRLSMIASGLERAIEEAELKTIGDPDVDHEKIELPEQGPMTFAFEVEVEPEFDLPGLEGIEITEHEREISEQDIDQQIENARWGSAVLGEQTEEAKIAENDQIVGDLKIEIGDEPPILTHEADIVVRSHPIEGILFEDLAKALDGTQVGQTIETQATVSDEHENEPWRGKQAKLSVTVKKISKWILPELNDELAQKVGANSVAEWREQLKVQLNAQKGQQIRRDKDDQVRKYLVENVSFDLPERLTDRQTQRVLVRRVIELRRMGVPEILVEEKLDELRTRARDQAVEDLKFSFICAKIARHYEIEVSDEEVNSTIAGIAIQQGRRPERIREEMVRDGSLSNVFEYVTEGKVLEKLIDNAKIVKAKPDQADEPSNKKTTDEDKNEPTDK